MSKAAKIIIIFLLIDAVAIGGFFLGRSLKKGGRAGLEIPWTTIDEAYRPANAVEEFIKTDAANRGSLPVFIRAYGRDAKVLRKFKGKKFAQPSEQVLALFFKGLDEWMIVDIKYMAENQREVLRTLLYVLDGGQWKVGDTGILVE
ncbi:MAG: hypothetical protein NTZ26_13705 [Candidatus Aminicenantes bacterium]|nr:hypothetical protein [Candidatus Aminicenantes bacterium]